MIFFVANDGTIIKGMPTQVYQGAANSNTIYLIAPFAANSTATVAFQLPNGVAVPPTAMTQQNALEGIVNEETGQTYAGWTYDIPSDITQYYGTVTAQFYFYGRGGSGGVETITATSSTSFQVGKGVPSALPETPSEDVYEAILANFETLQSRLNNGYYAARSIYAWNATYTYGANEITFYPDIGEFGAFVQSINTGNTGHVPYVNGAIDSAWWKEVVNFDNISEDFLNELNEIAESAAQSAEEAKAIAENIGQYAGKQIEFVDELPAQGEAGKLYGVISDEDANLYTIYAWENGAWTDKGSANLVLDIVRTYGGTLTVAGWQSNAQTVAVDGLKADDSINVAPADGSAKSFVQYGIVAATVADGGVVFTCESVPNVPITLNIEVTKEQDIPTANGYYTKTEIAALAGTATELEIDSSTYVITLKLKAIDGTLLSTNTIDLPLESVVVNGSYDADTKTIVLTLQNGNTVSIPVGDLVDGLASQTALNAEEAARVSADTALGTRIDGLVNGTTPAAKATEADSAITADKVENKLTITKNGQPYQEYDGSEAVGIDIASSTSQSSSTEVTLPSSDWSENRQDVTLSTVTATNNVDVYPKDVSAAAYVNAGIIVSQSDGKLVFTCTATPSADITVIVEVAA